MAILTSLKDALDRIGDGARLAGRELPVIATDIHSAMILRSILAAEIGCTVGDLSPPSMRSKNFVVMYDGVKIVAAVSDQLGFREHFGALAEIFA